MKEPLVSVIVPTKNSAATLEACLRSVQEQTYQAIEIVVIDNFSTDETFAITKRFTQNSYQQGPERSAQRNYGVNKASGSIVLIIDSDMELTKQVVEQCVSQFQSDAKLKGLVIPEESFGIGFWAQCKKLERSFYVGVSWMEAARAFRKDIYQEIGGYDETMISGEDWDLSQRIAEQGALGRVQAYIMHNEGHLKLMSTLRKKYYYAKQFANYTSKNPQTGNVSVQTGPLTRYKLFFSEPARLFKNPFLGMGMLFMKTCEFGFGAFGLVRAKHG